MAAKSPPNHPEIDWTKWRAPESGEVRSPCPVLNSLANHGILPRDGKGVTKEMAVKAMTSAINLDVEIAKIFASVALTTNPNAHAHSFDLDHVSRHGLIEHDVSLSRDDFALGDNHTFNADIWKSVLDTYGDSKETNFALATEARYNRVIAAKKAHEAANKDFTYGIKEAVLSYGETAILMSLLGNPKNGKIPVEYLKIVVEEERLPYEEGWRPAAHPITPIDLTDAVFKLIHANEHKSAEASEVGLGTVHAVQNAVTSILPTYCVIM
ncbi:Chloroperoxidase [Hyaloscypha finlandica]|nr:Chloroperoxidase [Hyaloscypha finlandica]KAH8768687.1 Chloroperoxidase [Hyaloscypha sp. PMI_1271]